MTAHDPTACTYCQAFAQAFGYPYGTRSHGPRPLTTSPANDPLAALIEAARQASAYLDVAREQVGSELDQLADLLADALEAYEPAPYRASATDPRNEPLVTGPATEADAPYRHPSEPALDTWESDPRD